MTNINQLSSMDTLSGGDLLAVWAQNNGDTRKSSLTLLLTFMQDNLTLPNTLQLNIRHPAPRLSRSRSQRPTHGFC